MKDFQIFLSYAKEDLFYASKIHQYLTDMYYPVWMDIHNIKPGEKWHTIISNAILSSSAVLVLLSKHSVTKIGYVQKEVRQILERSEYFPDSKIFIIPIRLDNTEIPYEMREIQYLDIYNDFQNGLQKLFTTLEDIFRSEIWSIRKKYSLEKRDNIINQIMNSKELFTTLNKFDFWFGSPERERDCQKELQFFYDNNLIIRDGESRYKWGGGYTGYSEYCFSVSLNEEGKIIKDYILGK